MLANNNIRYKTDTIGFLVMTIKIPEIVAIKVVMYKEIILNPLKMLKISNNNCIYILIFFLLFSFTGNGVRN